jgi:hypothetical protein
MKPLFTVHAGEYLVGSRIEKQFPRLNIWLPSKDTGVDLLLTNAKTTRAVSLQVKFSKDFTPTHHTPFIQSRIMATGWWTHQEKKIRDSKANFWIFVLPSFTEHKSSFVVIQPKELLRRLRVIHRRSEKRIHSYFWVTKTGRCWETRGLNKADQELIAFDRFRDRNRDFTPFLDRWSVIGKLIK